MNCKADSVVGGTDTKHGFVGQLRTKCKTGLRRRMCRRTASGLATNCINYAVFLEYVCYYLHVFFFTYACM